MSLFFEEKKGEKPFDKSRSTQKPEQGFFGALILLFISSTLAFLSWIFKPILTWAFTFENKTRKQVTTQLIVATFVLATPFCIIYRIPLVRDLLTLSNTHTINLNLNGHRIIFPDRSFFVPQENRHSMKSKENGITYITYAGYTPYVAQKTTTGECHMVYRGEKIILASLRPPIQAEGFDDVVIYPVRLPVSKLPFWQFLKEHVTHLSYFLKNKEELSGIMADREYESSWGDFLDNWRSIQEMPSGYKPFELKALANEHAIVCF